VIESWGDREIEEARGKMREEKRETVQNILAARTHLHSKADHATTR
jgi:hypothetical protein